MLTVYFNQSGVVINEFNLEDHKAVVRETITSLDSSANVCTMLGVQVYQYYIAKGVLDYTEVEFVINYVTYKPNKYGVCTWPKVCYAGVNLAETLLRAQIELRKQAR